MPHHRFQKGQPRPAKAGRRAGTPNKSTQDVGQFCRNVLETPEFRQKWREYFLKTPLHLLEPKLLALAFNYDYGKPRERVELTGAERAPLEPQVIFTFHQRSATQSRPRNWDGNHRESGTLNTRHKA